VNVISKRASELCGMLMIGDAELRYQLRRRRPGVSAEQLLKLLAALEERGLIESEMHYRLTANKTVATCDSTADQRGANHRKGSEALIGSDQRVVVSQRGRRDPQIVGRLPGGGGAQFAVASRDRPLNRDDHCLRQHRGETPEPLGASGAVACQQHTSLQLPDAHNAHNPRLIERRSKRAHQHAGVDQSGQAAQGSVAAAASASLSASSSAAQAGSVGVSASTAPSRSGAAGLRALARGPSSATGRPATVIVKRSPRSARWSTALTWFRNSRWAIWTTTAYCSNLATVARMLSRVLY